MKSLEVLVFVDSKVDGVVPVLGPDGSRVAAIRAATRRSRSFEVLDAEGARLRGVTHRGFLSRALEVTDHEGRPRLTVRFGLRGSAVVSTPDGRDYTVGGGSRGFALRTSDGDVIAQATPTSSRLSVHPDSYHVEVRRPDLELGDLTAIIEAHRRAIKRRRQATIAAAASSGGH